MIYEIATIAAFIILVIIFLLSTFLYSFCYKQEKNILENAQAFSKKINISLNLFVFFTSLLLFIKLIIFLFAADTILSFDSAAPSEINQIIIHFFYSVFWIIVLFAVSLKNEIKDEYQYLFIRKISIAGIIVFFSDFVLSGMVYVLNILHYFNLRISATDLSVGTGLVDISMALIVILILLFFLISLFIAFIIKRKIRMLKYYELTSLFLLIGIGYFVFFDTSNLIGWNEIVIYRLKLFSFEYGYVGFLFLILFALTLIANSFVIILFNLKNIFANAQMLKNKIISYLKIGFVSLILLFALAIMPRIFIWIY